MKIYFRIVPLIIASLHFTVKAQNSVIDRDLRLFFSDYFATQEQVLSTGKNSSIDFLLDSNFTSLVEPLKFKKLNYWLWKKAVNDPWLRLKGKDYRLTMDPYYRISTGNNTTNGKNYFFNRRGAYLNAQIGKKITFHSFLFEGPTKPDPFVAEYVNSTRILPGEGEIRMINGVTDNMYSFGGVSYQASKYIDFNLGHDKNFLGDGYRSMFLSDAASAYPYAKMNLHFGDIVQYDAIVAEFINYRPDMEPIGDVLRQKKYGSFHYLNIKLHKKLFFGAFESVIWGSDSAAGRMNLDLNYLNPFVIMRPQEFSIGSPDNVAVGLHSKYLPLDYLTFYGQFLITEFKSDEFFSKSKWWANKIAYQLGLKIHNVPGLKNFYAQLEYNHIKPFTYNHRSSATSYSHFGQSLAHPSGSNLKEVVFVGNYRHQRLNFNVQANYKFSGKEKSDSTSIGTDVLRSYELRESEYGVVIGQGITHHQVFSSAKVSYLINPSNMMFLELGLVNRWEKESNQTYSSNLIFIGLKTGLTNFYYDF